MYIYVCMNMRMIYKYINIYMCVCMDMCMPICMFIKSEGPGPCPRLRCTLQHGATPCNTLQHTAISYNTPHTHTNICTYLHSPRLRCALQHTATHCHTLLQHPATRRSTLQHTATNCSTLQHTARWNTLVLALCSLFFSFFLSLTLTFTHTHVTHTKESGHTCEGVMYDMHSFICIIEV